MSRKNNDTKRSAFILDQVLFSPLVYELHMLPYVLIILSCN